MIRAFMDNVILRLDPVSTETKSGLFIPDQQSLLGARTATVLASGPGFYNAQGHLIPNEVKAGERVLVDKLAGQNYSLDLTIPRHNKGIEFQELVGDRGEFRIVREQEILGVVEAEDAAA